MATLSGDAGHGAHQGQPSQVSPGTGCSAGLHTLNLGVGFSHIPWGSPVGCRGIPQPGGHRSIPVTWSLVCHCPLGSAFLWPWAGF